MFFLSLFISVRIDLIVGDAASECGTSYYSEYDPFDYLYSSGTQYSDPVYEAVIKIDRTPISPANNEEYAAANQYASSEIFDFKQISEQLEAASFTGPDWDARIDDFSDFTMVPPSLTAPPLPPRNISRNSSFAESKQPSVDRTNKVDRLKVAAKLYENVIENRTYDAELVAFFNMVSDYLGLIRITVQTKSLF